MKYQVKYYQSAEKTTKAISHPKYFGLPKIVPSDQLEDVKKIAEKLYLRNLHTRPDVAKNYLDTAQRVSDRIVAGNIVSKGAAEQELKQMVPELKNDTFSETKYGLTLNEYIEWSNIAKQAGRAAMTAALINAALKIAPDIINFVKKVLNDEKISSDDIKRLGSNVIEGSVEGALRGGIAAFFTIASRSGMLGQAYVNINPSIIGAATVVTINSIKNAFMLYSKKITPYEFADRCIQDSLIISLSTVGLILGQKYIPIPYLGAMIGSMVGTSLATMVSKGTKSFIMKPLMLSGFTFFGLVKQDYTLPDKVLDELGIETVDIEYIDIEYIDEEYVDIENIDIEYVDMEKLEFTMLERGFIKANVVGYIEK